MTTGGPAFVLFASVVLLCLIRWSRTFQIDSDIDSSEMWYGENNHILGGRDALEIVPYQVSLQRYFGHYAGGSIISRFHVVTAAHCFYANGVRLDPQDIVVVYATLYHKRGGARRECVAIHHHPRYRTNGKKNDIGVLKVSPEFDFSKPITQPIPLGTTLIGGNELVTASGWGSTVKDKVAVPDRLQTLNLLTVSNEQCLKISDRIDNSTLCAAGPSSQGICRGDSGGPLVRRIGNRVELVGIASFVLDMNNCGNSFPDFYTRVSSFVNFIKYATKKKIP